MRLCRSDVVPTAQRWIAPSVQSDVMCSASRAERASLAKQTSRTKRASRSRKGTHRSKKPNTFVLGFFVAGAQGLTLLGTGVLLLPFGRSKPGTGGQIAAKKPQRGFFLQSAQGTLPACLRGQIHILIAKEKTPRMWCLFFWQGHKDLNPGHAVLETAALPTELYPYIEK